MTVHTAWDLGQARLSEAAVDVVEDAQGFRLLAENDARSNLRHTIRVRVWLGDGLIDDESVMPRGQSSIGPLPRVTHIPRSQVAAIPTESRRSRVRQLEPSPLAGGVPVGLCHRRQGRIGAPSRARRRLPAG